MSSVSPIAPTFAAADLDLATVEGVGFRFGSKGVHTSRTMMLTELTATLDAVPAASPRSEYLTAIIDENCTHKSTDATRRKTVARLIELYALDPKVELFRVFRRAWDFSVEGRPLVALLCALARDGRLLSTAPSIIAMSEGAEFHRDVAKKAVLAAGDGRLNDAIVDKVVRNAASSWQQSGHLTGRTFKKKAAVRATPAVAAFAAYLAFNAGSRGVEIFRSGWFQVIDASPTRARELLLEAKQAGLIDLRIAGDVITLGFERLDPKPRKD